jgi:hypothetical protein
MCAPAGTPVQSARPHGSSAGVTTANRPASRIRDPLALGRLLHHCWPHHLPVGPAMAAGNGARRAFAREVDERITVRAAVRCGAGRRSNRFVAVQPLFRRPGHAAEVAQVELIARARRRQDAVAQLEQKRMAHHIDGERTRDARHARDLLGEAAVELLHDRVEERLVGIRGVDGRVDLGVDAVDHIERQQPVDDRGAVAIERLADRVRRALEGEPLSVTLIRINAERNRFSRAASGTHPRNGARPSAELGVSGWSISPMRWSTSVATKWEGSPAPEADRPKSHDLPGVGGGRLALVAPQILCCHQATAGGGRVQVELPRRAACSSRCRRVSRRLRRCTRRPCCAARPRRVYAGLVDDRAIAQRRAGT